MGADNLAQFHHWRDWEKIAETVPFAVFNRPGYFDQAMQSVTAKHFTKTRYEPAEANNLWRQEPPAWVFITNTNNPASSTAIRTSRSHNHNAKQEKKMPEKLYEFINLDPPRSNFRKDVIEGLSKIQKAISPQYFYDEKGSILFSAITQQNEYYPTRTELALMRQHMPAIAAALGDNPAIFEYGSGASEKIRYLIEGLSNLKSYVAMDISLDYLLESAQTLAKDYPHINVSAICADFNQVIDFPESLRAGNPRWTGYFPGSTIGNFTRDNAKAFMTRAHHNLGDDSQFLLGFDLVKDNEILNKAYNDGAGMTAKFNLNLLTRIERELGAKLTLDDFAHHAFFDAEKSRIEMHLAAKRPTKIIVNEYEYTFLKDETIHTEYSHKYTIEMMENLMEETPWSIDTTWTDARNWFALSLLRSTS